MGFGWGLVIGYALGGISGVVVFAWIFGTKAEGVAEAEADATERQMDQLKQSQEVKDATLARMADADAASGAESADRKRERMRTRDPRTR